MSDESYARTGGGLITIVTAVITAAISSFTTYMVQRQQIRVEHEKLEAQLQEKVRELADEHQKARVANLAREDEIQQRLARELQGRYFEVLAQNICSKASVVVAVRYQNLNGKMMVHGWSTVGPGQTVTILKTEEREFWYFPRAVPAELSSAFQPPYGQDDLAVRITNYANFEYVEDGDYSWLALQQPTNQPFKHVTIKPSAKPGTQIFLPAFSCL
jgi:hypothetical protein